MRVIRRRYLALKPENDTRVQEMDLATVVEKAILQLFGEFGVSKASLHFVGIDDRSGTTIIRCSHKALRMVRSSIAAVTKVNGDPLVIRVVAVSGTLKSLRNKLRCRLGPATAEECTPITSELRKWSKGAKRIVIIGIGNPLRQDDFAGMKTVRHMKGRLSSRVMVIESETVPESFIEDITHFQPTHILIIDTGLLGLEPGKARLLTSGELLGPLTPPVSTHALPLRLFCEYLKIALDVSPALILIEPERTDFGEGLSERVEASSKRLGKALLQIVREL